MSQLVRALLAALIGLLLGFATPLTAFAAPTPRAPSYAYDGNHDNAVSTYTTCERGPPATYNCDTAHVADGQRSSGAPVRLYDTAPLADFAYVHPALVQVASVTTTKQGLAPVVSVELCASPATRDAAESGSALARASQAAFRAAENPSSIFVKSKHLASAGGNSAKFASDDISQIQGWISRGLQSEGVQFLPNQLDDTFRAVVPGGGPIGTRGQEFIRVIVTGDGRVINAFPVNAR